MKPILGTTKLVGVFGHPVGHSLSPVMHNAAFDALGMDWCYVPFEVAPQALAGAIRSLIPLGIVGVNLTIPHKEQALALVDEVDAQAMRVGAINTIHQDQGRLIGYNTDGAGFLRPLSELPMNLEGSQVVVLGAGGAAKGVAFALAEARAARIWIFNRTASRAESLARLVSEAPGLRTEVIPGGWECEDMKRALEQAQLLVNATPIGMSPHDDQLVPVPEEALHPDLMVYDLVYHPLKTGLLQLAESRGCRTMSGVKMLVYQGAVSFRIWTGVDAPAQVMEQAILEQLAEQCPN